MKYRMLSDEELGVLEEDLKQFLIVNGVDGDTWAKMNSDNPNQAQVLVEMFSDTVLQKVYEKTRFIEHRSKEACLVFKLGKDQIELISLNAKDANGVDLSTPESIHEALTKKTSQLSIFKTEKGYQKDREQEIHQMFMNGCVVSSEAFWILLEKVL